jgi:hypothetical protein
LDSFFTFTYLITINCDTRDFSVEEWKFGLTQSNHADKSALPFLASMQLADAIRSLGTICSPQCANVLMPILDQTTSMQHERFAMYQRFAEDLPGGKRPNNSQFYRILSIDDTRI